jgi:hypothetical protein
MSHDRIFHFTRYSSLPSILVFLIVGLAAAPSLAQTGESNDTSLSADEHPAANKPAAAAFNNVKGITLGMTADQVTEKLGKPDTSDQTGMLFTLPNDQTLQLSLDADKKVRMIATVYSGKNAKAPEPVEVFGSGETVRPQADGRIYKLVRYPDAGYWIAYSRLNLESGPMTTITIQKIN